MDSSVALEVPLRTKILGLRGRAALANHKSLSARTSKAPYACQNCCPRPDVKVAAVIGRWRDGDPSRFSFLHRCYVDAICCREGEDHALTKLASAHHTTRSHWRLSLAGLAWASRSPGTRRGGCRQGAGVLSFTSVDSVVCWFGNQP